MEYVLKNGVATCVDETRDQIYYLRNLEHFSVMDQGKERGQGGSVGFPSSRLVRDKVAQILAMVQDNETMQVERQKARRLKKKFANTKSVGSAPAPAPAAPKSFFGKPAAPKPAPTFSGPSYRVKGGELADIPSAGQVAKPSSKLMSTMASFGHKMGDVVSSAAASVSAAASSVTGAAAPAQPAQRLQTRLRNFRDLEDTEEDLAPEPEPEPAPLPAPKPAPAKPKVTRASKEADALFNFGGVACVNTTVERVEEPKPAAPASAPANNLFAPAPAPANDLFAPAAAPKAEAPKEAPKPTDAFDFFSDIPSSVPAAPAPKPAQQTDAFGGLMDGFMMPTQQPMQQQTMQQQTMQQPMQQQTMQQPMQQNMYQQQYQQRMYQQQYQQQYQMNPQQQQYQQMTPQQQQQYMQMYQQQRMYQQQQQQRGGFNMTGF